MDKAEKIKAARRKLKEFQSQKNQVGDNPNVLADEKIVRTEEEVIAPIQPEHFNVSLEKEQKVLENPSQQEPQQQYQSISSFFDSIPSESANVFNQQIAQQPSAPNVIIPAPTNVFQSPPQPQQQSQIHQLQQQLQMMPTSIQMMAQPYLDIFANNGDKLQESEQLVQQQNHQISQLKSEVEFHRSTATNLQKNMEELNRFKQQEHQQSDVVRVLVTEKSNLIDSLHKIEIEVQGLKNENEELHNRLNVSRHRVKQLETQAQHQQPQPQAHQHEFDAAKFEEMISERVKQLQNANEIVETERNELKLLLNQKRIEMENLQRNFDHINTELHLATVKIAQLSDGGVLESPETIHLSQINALNQDVAIKQQQINELNTIIDQLNNEKDACEAQYQNYVSAITTENNELKENSVELTNENNALTKREQELLKHISDLERQMQQHLQKQRIYAEHNALQSSPTRESHEEIHKLTSQISVLTEANESFKIHLSQIEADKLELSKTIQLKMEEVQNLEFQMEKLRTVTPNLTQLMTDFEDKSTAASRALSQNQSLKEQLEELQRAFVTISNDKMELTDKLQSEIHLAREFKNRNVIVEEDLAAMKDKWQFKENEMIRLSHENTELEKKILQQNIEIDRLRHYESKDYHGTEGILGDELEHCKHLIESLTNKINVLESGKAHDHDHSHDAHDNSHDAHDHDHSHDGHGHSHDHKHSHDDHKHSNEEHSHSHKDKGHVHSHNHDSQCDDSKKHLLEEIEMLKMEKNELIKAINDFQMNKKSSADEQDPENPIPNGDEPEEMSDEKMKQLTVSKSVTASIATEEALEKLQSRFRRTMLEVAELTEEKQRLEHVVTQLQFETETIGEYITLYQHQRRLLKQKEHERDVQLKNLAADRELMNKKLLQLNGLIEKFVLQHTDQIEIAKEATKLLEHHNVNGEPIIISPDNNNEVDFEKLKKETAGKILEILTDIKSTNTKSYDANVGVEQCSCCLGKLETV